MEFRRQHQANRRSIARVGAGTKTTAVTQARTVHRGGRRKNRLVAPQSRAGSQTGATVRRIGSRVRSEGLWRDGRRRVKVNLDGSAVVFYAPPNRTGSRTTMDDD